MNRNRLIGGLLIAFVVALLASAFVYRQLQLASSARPVSMQQIVVANAALPLGTRLTPSNIRVIPLAGQRFHTWNADPHQKTPPIAPSLPRLLQMNRF